MKAKPGDHLKYASPEERKRIARMGGKAVSQDRAHMSEIGKRGGVSVSENRAWMSEIGRRGGHAIKAKKK